MSTVLLSASPYPLSRMLSKYSAHAKYDWMSCKLRPFRCIRIMDASDLDRLSIGRIRNSFLYRVWLVDVLENDPICVIMGSGSNIAATFRGTFFY